jgi:hypothetical protein
MGSSRPGNFPYLLVRIEQLYALRGCYFILYRRNKTWQNVDIADLKTQCGQSIILLQVLFVCLKTFKQF